MNHFVICDLMKQFLYTFFMNFHANTVFLICSKYLNRAPDPNRLLLERSYTFCTFRHFFQIYIEIYIVHPNLYQAILNSGLQNSLHYLFPTSQHARTVNVIHIIKFIGASPVSQQRFICHRTSPCQTNFSKFYLKNLYY